MRCVSELLWYWAALEAGINLFDHAGMYSRGKSAIVFGTLLKGRVVRREKVVLQARSGIRFEDDPPGAPQHYDFSYEHIIRSVEGSS
ncbi:aldo/keto reductase [Rhodothermus profundi]|uniref:aldo/keto reductase n=1 Tax=Rhodothermus profundi TaxID=633813 RepID=UPI000932B1CA|nr:aldo/keto reductase [Rhodothermus profundi]